MITSGASAKRVIHLFVCQNDVNATPSAASTMSVDRLSNENRPVRRIDRPVVKLIICASVRKLTKTNVTHAAAPASMKSVALLTPLRWRKISWKLPQAASAARAVFARLKTWMRHRLRSRTQLGP